MNKQRPDLFRTMYTMRALRRFKPDPIPEEVLFQLFDAAIRAPSGQNVQDWRFIIVTDPAVKRNMQAWAGEGWARYQPEYAERPELMAAPFRGARRKAHDNYPAAAEVDGGNEGRCPTLGFKNGHELTRRGRRLLSNGDIQDQRGGECRHRGSRPAPDREFAPELHHFSRLSAHHPSRAAGLNLFEDTLEAT